MILSFLGKIFGNKEKTKTVKNTVDYEAMRDSAEKAGFNPLTVLRNGGSAGFTQTHSPVLSRNWFGHLTDTIQETAATALGAMSGMPTGTMAMPFDRDPIQSGAIERKLQHSTLQRYNRGEKVNTQLGAAPAAKGTNTLKTWMDKHRGDDASPWAPIEAGGFLTTNPWMAPGQAIEDEYLELISLPYGFVKTGVDIAYSTYLLGKRVLSSDANGNNTVVIDSNALAARPRAKDASRAVDTARQAVKRQTRGYYNAGRYENWIGR